MGEWMMCMCVDVEIGSYDATVLIVTPEHMRGLTFGCYTMRDVLTIDACIVPEIAALWRQGIVTTGSCCGHNKLPGYRAWRRWAISTFAIRAPAIPTQSHSRSGARGEASSSL